MKDLEQLKAVRDAALARLADNADFKTVNVLEGLIQDLETAASVESEIAASLQTSLETEESDEETVTDVAGAFGSQRSDLNGSYSGSNDYQ